MPFDFGTGKRPFVVEFLLKAVKHWEIVVMTAGQEEYASPVLDALENLCGRRVIKHRLYREACTVVNSSDAVPISYLFLN